MRLPARQGLNADEPEWLLVDDVLSNRFFELLGFRGKVWELDSPFVAPPFGYYLVKSSEKEIFLKVIPEKNCQSQVSADEVGQYLNKFKIGVSLLLEGFPKSLEQGVSVLAYTWISGESVPLRPKTMRSFGRELGYLHRSLKQYPKKEQIALASKSRIGDLQSFLLSHVFKSDRWKNYEEYFDSYLNKSSNIFTFSEECQVIHGDLNVGNVRWGREGITFLDFEDTSFSYLPVRMEIAFVLERFLLVNSENKDAFNLSLDFITSYKAICSMEPFHWRGALSDSLYWLALRSVCLLIKYESGGVVWPESEWEKFIILLRQIESKKELIEKIEEI